MRPAGRRLNLDHLAGRALETVLYSEIRRGRGESLALFFMWAQRFSLPAPAATPKSCNKKLSPGAGFAEAHYAETAERLRRGLECPVEPTLAQMHCTLMTCSARIACADEVFRKTGTPWRVPAPKPSKRFTFHVFAKTYTPRLGCV